MINVLILAAQSTANAKDGNYPAFLMEIGNVTLLEHWLKQVKILSGHLHLVVSEKDSESFHLNQLVKQLGDGVKTHLIQDKTAGATCSALLALDDLQLEDELLILNGNEYLDFNFSEALQTFKDQKSSAGLVYFDSIHPRYSYARITDSGEVLEVAEKTTISRNATVGFYWYESTQLFIEAASRQLLKRATLGDVYYVCPVFNEVILLGKKVGSHFIEADKFVSLKSDFQRTNAEEMLK